MELKIEYIFECSVCGDEVEVLLDDLDGYLPYKQMRVFAKVTPCQNCLDKAYEEAHELNITGENS